MLSTGLRPFSHMTGHLYSDSYKVGIIKLIFQIGNLMLREIQ